MKLPTYLALVSVWLSGCTVIQVKPISKSTHNIVEVCIEQNDNVKMSGFLPMLEKTFANHGIASQRYQGRPPDGCEYTASYVAHWTWDLAIYLTDAEVVIRRGGEVVGTAVYHLRNKGGLDLGKWGSAEGKMTPVMDQLLANFTASDGAFVRTTERVPPVTHPPASQMAKAVPVAVTVDKPSDPKYAKLVELKKLLDSGVVTQDEFNREKTKILDSP